MSALDVLSDMTLFVEIVERGSLSAAGRLKAVLHRARLSPVDITALTPRAVAPTPALRALLDHLAAR